MKKKSIICLVMVMLLLALGRKENVYAAEFVPGDYMQNEVIVPFKEETQWYYRVVDGRLQRRLWSNTYNKWLTDWEWVF